MSEYSKGFDHGCDYIIAEIERYADQHSHDPLVEMPLRLLLTHLKVADDLGKPPRKNQ